MNNPAVFIKEPLHFKKNIKIFPPSVRDVVGNLKFNQYLKILTISQDDLQDELGKKLTEGEKAPTPMEFLLNNCYHFPEFKAVAQEAFLLFLHQPVTFFYEEKLIVVGRLEDVVTKIKSINELDVIREEDYFDFQNIVRESCGYEPLTPIELPNPNEDPRITAMKAKARARDRAKAKQSAKDGISIQTCLVAICCMGIGLTPLNIGEMSYAAIGPIMQMSQEKEKYDIDIRSLLAGADSKKIKPKYWIRNSDKE